MSDSKRVLNPSLIGYSSRDYANIVSQMARSDEFDIGRITVFWCLNDAYSDGSTTTALAGARQFLPTFSLFVYRHIRTYQWMKKQFFDRPRAHYLFDKILYEPESSAFANAQADIVVIRDTARKMGARLEFILLPYEYQSRGGDRKPQERMIFVLDSLQIPYVNVLPGLRRKILASTDSEASSYYLYGDGIHFSAKGHRAISQLLLLPDMIDEDQRN